ncbi:MAG: YggS family pyridoxal phosphate-dependent enzyme [Firmicutes bacterium]|nr:YggS family pyridoxal phosphate-dependent enzyme [Bacillota bacterium]
MLTEERKKEIKTNIDRIKSEMAQAKEKSPYGQDTVLLAATKTRTAEEINYAIECGITRIGENRVQEMLERYDDINRDKVAFDFIGALQTNKVKYIIDKVDMIQSVDRLELAREIDRQAKKHNLVMDILVEINIGGEQSKSGIAPEDAESFIREISSFEGIKIKGLMSIPPICTDIDKQKNYFKKIMNIFIDISAKKIDNVDMSILSFGMSDDYMLGIECGSTMVRVGTAIFGARDYTKKQMN